ncbi:MAG: hypothetical protein ACRESI_06995 [Gammaproteobacteria bacterium]
MITLNRLSVFIIVIVLTCSASAQESRTGKMLRVEATQTNSGGEPAIKFTVENTSAVTLEMYSADLPWANRYSIVVVVVTKNGAEMLPQSAPIDDAGPGTTIIKHGERLHGSRPLTSYVNGLNKAREKGDVLIFWFYGPKDTKGKKLGNFGGWLILPKI